MFWNSLFQSASNWSRTPYKVFYYVEAEQVEVIGVVHAKRSPAVFVVAHGFLEFDRGFGVEEVFHFFSSFSMRR
jgi:hypothetical protein